jgi:hypothetical protein
MSPRAPFIFKTKSACDSSSRALQKLREMWTVVTGDVPTIIVCMNCRLAFKSIHFDLQGQRKKTAVYKGHTIGAIIYDSSILEIRKILQNILSISSLLSGDIQRIVTFGRWPKGFLSTSRMNGAPYSSRRYVGVEIADVLEAYASS